MSSWAETMKEIDFTAQASTSERRIMVSLSGTADLTVKSQLDRFLREVHAEAQRCLAEVVTVDVRLLEFMPQVLRVVGKHRAGTTWRGKVPHRFPVEPIGVLAAAQPQCPGLSG
jgi:hypothetical protein